MDERHNKRQGLRILMVPLLCFASVLHAAEQYSEDALKAAYLLRFPGYVSWPNGRPVDPLVDTSADPSNNPPTNPSTNTPPNPPSNPPNQGQPEVITIAILGAPGVARELTEMIGRQSADARKVRLRRIESLAQIGKVHVLFIGSDRATSSVQRMIASLDNQPVLVVTDDKLGLKMGGAINFTQVDRRVRFEVSLPQAKRSGLKISSELLSVAVRVDVDQSPAGVCSNEDPAASLQCKKAVVGR